MLSFETKMERANKALEFLDVRLKFDCYDLKTYTPTYEQLDRKRPVNTKVHLRTDIVYMNGKPLINFAISRVYETDLDSSVTIYHYYKYIKKVYEIINYCNSLKIELPKYKGG